MNLVKYFVTEPPAVFTEELQDKIVKEKDTLKLRCKLNEPDVSVLWFKGSKEINELARI